MKPSLWKQWWNGLWYGRPADDDTVEWLIDFLGFWPIQVALVMGIMIGFVAWMKFLDWWYLKRPLCEDQE